MLISIGSFIFRGFKYGVDFTGGSLLQIRFEKPVSVEAMRSAMSAVGEGGASIQQDERGDFLIRVKPQDFGGKETFGAVLGRQMSTSFAGNPFEIVREETVGPQVSKELQGKVLLAVALGLIGILIYVSFRFDFRFGSTGVLALFHDLIIVLGVMSAFGREISIPVIAALLTIVGYDINDTIVVSDRIREDVRKMRKEKFSDVVNQAINKTLSRTVITSLTVFIISLCLLIFGAAAIQDFALAMVVGVIFGTYSSIFIVAQLVVEWEKKMPSRMRRI